MIRFLTRILENSSIWITFRRLEDYLFGLYRTRMKVIRNFGITEKMSVIDIACGAGQYSAITDANYLGVDLSQKYIDAASKLYGNERKKFLCADANTAAIRDASYDIAILIDATHHLSDQENKTLLATLNRIASQYVIICDPIQQKPTNLIGRFMNSLDRGDHIRPKNDLLNMVGGVLTIEKVVDLKMIGIESVCIFAKPRRSTSANNGSKNQ